ncbi:DUF222 domain-containing protein [Rathayibacter sp. VKM Ac-2803]|uniref:HNH endonuclease signature motif containing protein n=1 Tax=Rathayibacter sp. VKM Ac-2803 TaxID=2609256 RepID=UPI001356D32F|nr:HNH endonuclease signature motif containing protein [Rathayibacter sp. VKM Ac-2803]MWV51084.1 DUF222 domain-containing protein [Rathayibacter sp. VKM Ac-2803]
MEMIGTAEAAPAEAVPAEAVLAAVRECGDGVAGEDRAMAPRLLATAERLYAGHRRALEAQESFARGLRLSRSEANDLAERSIRAELAVALGTSEWAVSRRLEHAQLLVEDLPLTRAALAGARILWQSGELICRTASTLPPESRATLDERAADAALTMTPTQLRRALARWREQLHEQPLTQRHARAREDRAVWLTPEVDGMATLTACLPAPAALGAYHRLDRIARSLRDGDDGSGDERTLAQLRADALADLLCDGDILGTTPVSDEQAPAPTFVPGVRAEVRLTLPATTAAGLDDAAADLDGYGPIPADVARALVDRGASFTRVLTDPHTRTVTSVGRTHRVPPAQMRLHLQLRDQTCRFPGCTRPASTAEADHTIEWRNGGETSLENLASLCTAHHHVRHGDRWTYVLHADGTADWTTPTGRHVTTRPPALPGSPPAPPPRPRFTDAPPPF